MTDNVNNALDFNDPQVVEIIEADESLKDLPLDSEDLKAAVNDKLTKKDGNTKSAVSEDGEDEVEEDSDEKSEEDSQDGSKKKPKRGMLHRIEKLVGEKHAMQNQIAELQSQLQGNAKNAVEEAVGNFQFDVKEPVFSDFDNIADFNKAIARWEFKRLKAEEAFEAEKASVYAKINEVASRWEQLEKEAKKSLPDYSSYVNAEAVNEANLSQSAKEFLAESDFGPHVIYELFSDEALLEKFESASSAKQVKMLTKIEQKYESSDEEPEEPKKSTVTSKPKLPTPLPRGKSSSVGFDLIKDADKLSDAEWSRLYDEQRRRK